VVSFEHEGEGPFQSRAGFSECLDVIGDVDIEPLYKFQSRAGFSECLDVRNFIYLVVNLFVSIPCWVF